MNREQIIQKARDEAARDRAAISGMDPMEKRALLAAVILVAVIVSLSFAIIRWVF